MREGVPQVYRSSNGDADGDHQDPQEMENDDLAEMVDVDLLGGLGTGQLSGVFFLSSS